MPVFTTVTSFRSFSPMYRWPHRTLKGQLQPTVGSQLLASAFNTSWRRKRNLIIVSSHRTFHSSERNDNVTFCVLNQFYSKFDVHRLNSVTIYRNISTKSQLLEDKAPKAEEALKENEMVDEQPDHFRAGVQKAEYSSESYPKESENDIRKQKSADDKPGTAVPASVVATADKGVKREFLESEKLPSRVQRYFLWRYTWYLKKLQESLKNEMPDTFNMFHIFTVGVKNFVLDFKELIKILVYLSLPGSTLRSLTHRELEVYYHMPWDMVRVFPVLLLSSFPLGQNIAFPVGYWFPRHLLCHHFWDIQQRQEFAVLGLKKRLFNARPVFRCLQAAVLNIADEQERERCKAVFFKLGSGIHPTTDEIVALKPLFEGHPFHIRKLGMNHVNGLLRLHGRSVWLWRRQRLKDHARILHCMDAAISREGIDSLTLDNLKASLFLRGLNPINMSTSAMVEYLESWLRVSQVLDNASYSLLLHLPILLAYNQPSNFALIYN